MLFGVIQRSCNDMILCLFAKFNPKSIGESPQSFVLPIPMLYWILIWNQT